MLYTKYLQHGMLEKKNYFLYVSVGRLASLKRGIHLVVLETKQILLLFEGVFGRNIV